MNSVVLVVSPRMSGASEFLQHYVFQDGKHTNDVYIQYYIGRNLDLLQQTLYQKWIGQFVSVAVHEEG